MGQISVPTTPVKLVVAHVNVGGVLFASLNALSAVRNAQGQYFVAYMPGTFVPGTLPGISVQMTVQIGATQNRCIASGDDGGCNIFFYDNAGAAQDQPFILIAIGGAVFV